MLIEETLRRPFALAALAERRLHESYLGRAATIYGWGIGVSYGLLIVLAPASAWALVARAFVTACSIVGALVVCAALRDALGERGRDGLAALGREAGFGGWAIHAARAVGALLRAVRAIGAPSVVLCVLALFASIAGGAR